jgi:hypothetical protein
MPVLDVGTGVGYLRILAPIDPARACLLNGRGRPGEEDRGSKGGSSEGAGRFTPATVLVEEASGGRAGSPVSVACASLFSGEGVMLMQLHQKACQGRTEEN